jgi:hypothetical protein
MTGEIALNCALASCGNAVLRGREYDDALLRRLLAFVSELRFWFRRDAAGATAVAGTSASAWFERLRRDGVRRLSLLHGSAATSPEMRPVMAAFVGGTGSWTLATEEPGTSAWWISGWEHTGARGSATPWTVTYYGEPHQQIAVDAGDPATVAAHFSAALRDATTFAAAHEDLTRWCEWFDRALHALASDAPETVLTASMAPVLAIAVHPLAARRLVAAAQCAWVFGGMSWWNDWGSRDKRIETRYRDITAALYASVIEAILCGVNTLSE